MAEPETGQNLNVKIGDEELKGRYSEPAPHHPYPRGVHPRLASNLVPPQGMVTSRIVTSPGHLKRIVEALATNLSRYEEAFGPIPVAPDPTGGRKVN
ncbi:MAG: DUF3467 domain-containing protein [Thermoanaerobaculia bacterium]